MLVIGAGGLGAPVLQYLAGVGIGQLILLDHDQIELTNLHRQPMYQMHDIGQAKVSSALRMLAQLNPEVSVQAYQTVLSADNADYFVEMADIVIDCADSYAVTYILSDACMRSQRPLIAAAALGQRGYVGGFCGHAPSFRAVFPELPNEEATCTRARVLGTTVGILGAIQAHMALHSILAAEVSPLGKLISLDLASLQTSYINFTQAQEPAVPPFIFTTISQIHPSDWVVDLRQPAADEPVCAQVQSYSLAQFLACQPHPLPKQTAVFVCQSGVRAWQVAKALRQFWQEPSKQGQIKLIATSCVAKAPVERCGCSLAS